MPASDRPPALPHPHRATSIRSGRSGSNVWPSPSGNDNGRFTSPKQPIRHRLQGLPAFVVTRGGEYCFLPGLRALRWLADRDT